MQLQQITATSHLAHNEKRRISRAYGQHLDQFAWDFFATLTFACEVGIATASQRFLAWIRRLERSAQAPVPWFLGMENGDAGGRLHLHALVGGVSHLALSLLQRAWPHGQAHIRRYQAGRGAAYYVAKFTGEDFTMHDLSKRLPPSLQSGAK
jgi:hypothetical protein